MRCSVKLIRGQRRSSASQRLEVDGGSKGLLSSGPNGAGSRLGSDGERLAVREYSEQSPRDDNPCRPEEEDGNLALVSAEPQREARSRDELSSQHRASLFRV